MSAARSRRLGVAAALAAWTAAAAAGTFDDTRVAVPFVKIAQGARASGMGEAFTAVADDATGVFWNPAGLAQVSRVHVQFTHNEWVDDFRQEAFSIAVPWAGAWALSYTLMDLGKFAEVDAVNTPSGRTFSVNDQVLQVGYGRGFHADAVMAGAAVKLIKEDLDGGVHGQAVSLSAGALVAPMFEQPRLTFAAVVENAGGELSGFALPLTVRLGVAWRKLGIFAGAPEDTETGLEREARRTSRYPWDVESVLVDSLTASSDVVLPLRGRVEWHAGLEYWLSAFAVRAGYRFRFPRNDLGGPSGLTLGAGLRGRGFQFDYGFDASYAPYGDLGSASRFSLIVTF